ncbi:MAG: alpha/beta hydrolase [Planctomycetota bacterium]|nr:alpha/beta hydrolase [Planctomycetota bacterium]
MKRRRWLRRLGYVVAVVCVLFNVIAYCQARAMTQFSRGGPPMPKPEHLSLSAKLWYGLFGVSVPRPENHETPVDHELEYSDRTVEVAPGVKLELWWVPALESRGFVIALHGYGDCKSKLLTETEVFHDLGYDVMLVDFRGSGGSSASHTSLGVEEAEDLEAVWAYVTEESRGRPIYLYGRSMGAVAALRGMSRGQIKPAGAILECPFDRMSTAIRRRCDLVGAPRFPTAELLLFWGSVQLGMNAFEHNPVDYARDVTCPVLLLRGGDDPRVHQSDLEEIARSLPTAPKVEVFAGCTHDPCVRHDRTRFREILADFFKNDPPVIPAF